MSAYKILVDSSVWIDFFKTGGAPVLDRFIEENLICINEIILTELAPVLKKKGATEALKGLEAIERVPLRIDWDIIRRYQYMNLENGINKVGIPDLIIVQQVIDQKLTLFSWDKHFRLMNDFLNFEMLGGM